MREIEKEGKKGCERQRKRIEILRRILSKTL